MSIIKKIMSFLILEENLKSLWRQYGVFFIVGTISFGLSVIFLRVFYKDLQMNLMSANVLSFILVSLINYLLSIRFVFLRGKFTVLKEMFYFYMIAVFSLIMDSLLLIYLVDKIEVWYVFAKFITVFTVSFLTFGLKKFWVFKK